MARPQLVVTRPAAQAAPWVERLRALGVDAVALPLIGIAGPADEAAVHRAWEQLGEHALAVFVSPNAVQQFFAARPPQCAWPAATIAGAPGPGTADALRLAGVDPARVVEPAADAASFDSEALWAQLAARDWRGARVLVVRGDGGREWLAETLAAHGAEVGFVAAYRRCGPVVDAAARGLLAAAAADPAAFVWHFSSSEAVRALQALLPQPLLQRSQALATHPRIEAAAQAAGFAGVARVGVRPEDVARHLGSPPAA